MDATLTIVVQALRETAGMVLDPSERVFWGFLLSSALIAVVVQRSTVPMRTAHRRWLHRSAGLDYQLLVANALIRGFIGVSWTITTFGFAVWVVGQLTGHFGTPDVSSLGATQITVLYTAVLFVTWDASRYLLHRWAHTVPALWEIHKVHHSAEVMTPFTLYRAHPIESILFALRGVLVTGVVTGVFFYFFRRDAIELELLGVNAVGFLFNVAGGNLRHSHVWWSWGPRLERWIISPAQHQLHHTPEWAATNMGTWLAIWDRLGGTLKTAQCRPPSRFGLFPAEANHHPYRLGSALGRPVWAGLHRLVGRRLAPAASRPRERDHEITAA